MEPEGLVTIDSPMEAEATLAWLEAALKAKGVTVFARIDHAAGAAAVGLSLPATAVLIFGNAQAGTKLMQIDQRIGIDLPAALSGLDRRGWDNARLLQRPGLDRDTLWD